MDHIDIRVTIHGELAKRFRHYVEGTWGSQYGAQVLVIKRAIEQFLDREEAVVYQSVDRKAVAEDLREPATVSAEPTERPSG